MPDREKVIKGLEYCEEYFNCCDKCPYWNGGTHCAADLAHDALALLKEQEHVKPIEYKACADAMLKMWMENVLTDGEYNKIMDKLNKAYKEGRI
jgi:hypothetical protein